MQSAVDNQVLIVEDDPRLRSALTKSLRAYGFQVHTVGTAAAAREILRVEAVNALVVDLGLPDESGWELIRWVRSAHGTKLRTIVITAAYRPTSPGSALTSDVILQKPFAIEALIRHLSKSGRPIVADISSQEGCVR